MDIEATRIVVDQESGVAYEQTVIDTTPKRGEKPEPNYGFTQVWVQEFISIIMSTGAQRSFLYLADRMDPKTGEVFVDIKPMMKALGYAHAPAVSKLISELVLVELVDRPRHGWLRVNPNVAWRGSKKQRSIAQFHWEQAHRHSDNAYKLHLGKD